MAKRERRPANLQCNNCGQQFVDKVWHVPISSDEQEVIGWNIDNDATRGVVCPSCGSSSIQVQ